jgi:hypothetical protein
LLTENGENPSVSRRVSTRTATLAVPGGEKRQATPCAPSIGAMCRELLEPDPRPGVTLSNRVWHDNWRMVSVLWIDRKVPTGMPGGVEAFKFRCLPD